MAREKANVKSSDLSGVSKTKTLKTQTLWVPRKLRPLRAILFVVCLFNVFNSIATMCREREKKKQIALVDTGRHARSEYYWRHPYCEWGSEFASPQFRRQLVGIERRRPLCSCNIFALSILNILFEVECSDLWPKTLENYKLKWEIRMDLGWFISGGNNSWFNDNTVNLVPGLKRSIGYWPSQWGQDGWILAKFFFCVLWIETESRSINSQKRTRPISSHLDRTSLVNKGFILWLLGKFFLLDTADSPERAR